MAQQKGAHSPLLRSFFSLNDYLVQDIQKYPK
jgi:hypothetical protein